MNVISSRNNSTVAYLTVFAVSFASSLYLIPPFPSSQPRSLDPETVRFVGDVICEMEFSEKGETKISRWAKSPRLSVFENDDLHPVVVKNVVKQINDCLPKEIQIKHLPDKDDSANMKVYFVPVSEFPKIAEQHGFQWVEGNWGFFDLRWNQDHEIQRAIVLIATDKLYGSRLHHFLLEEVTQSLGMAGDSKRYPKSVFYEDEPRGKFGKATRLSPLDRKTIRFFYEHVKPGSQPIEVGVQMAKHW